MSAALLERLARDLPPSWVSPAEREQLRAMAARLKDRQDEPTRPVELPGSVPTRRSP